MSAWLEPKQSEIPFDVLIRVRTHKGQQRAVKRIRPNSKDTKFVLLGNGHSHYIPRGQDSAYVTLQAPFEAFNHSDIASWRR
jgi:hypothetical protein